MSEKRRRRKNEANPRKRRPRPIPVRIRKPSDLDDMARRRCLMILSVLSGELPVSDAIEQGQISRQLYYDLEERALNAMLLAMTTNAETNAASPQARIAELEEQCKKLEQHKRRSERLLALTRQVLKPGSLKAAPGRPKKKRAASSTHRGSKPSPSSISSKTPALASSPPSESEQIPMSPTKDGAVAR